ncbi:MAG: hypothetical protein RMJ31_05965 [Nitrososphaerota archaeon]|nr:hypothetical protein [Nitrososphaerota archaeon]
MKMFIIGVDQALREESVSALQTEYVELEGAFLTMIFSPLIGIRLSTTLISLELLEELKGELKVLESRAFKGEDVLTDLMSSLGSGL